MLLHLVHDDKVVPRMISQFEEVNPGKNIYICVSNYNNKCKLKFLKETPHVIMSSSREVSSIPWKDIDKVCFHYLSFKKIRYYLKLSLRYNLKHTKTIWFFWGGDIFDVLGRKGYQLYSNDNSIVSIRNQGIQSKKTAKSFVEHVYLQIYNKISDYFKCYFFDKKFDYIICNSKEEISLFSKFVGFSKCKMILPYHYYPIEDTLGDLKEMKAHGDSVIVGNSASPTNNHEYVLNYLSRIKFADRKIYVPLSYSRDEKYVNVINEKYAVLPNAMLLNDFLPLDEYYRLLTECSTFIYGHFRTEGWGNILIALYLGGKIYVSNKSVLPEFLKSMGFKFFITEALESTFNEELTQEEKDNNRSIVLKNYSREINRDYIKRICEL